MAFAVNKASNLFGTMINKPNVNSQKPAVNTIPKQFGNKSEIPVAKSAYNNSVQIRPEYTITMSNQDSAINENLFQPIQSNYRKSSMALPQAPPSLSINHYDPSQQIANQIQKPNDDIFSFQQNQNAQEKISTAGMYSGVSTRNLNDNFGGMKYGFGQVNQTKKRGGTVRLQAVPDKHADAQTSNDAVNTTDVSSSEEKLVSKEQQNEVDKKKFNPMYSFFVLFLVLAARVIVQWHRKGLNYAYGYKGLGEAAGNSFYEIATAYPQLDNWYGLLTGIIYTIPYSFFGLIAGKISDNVNRKLFLGAVVILGSLTMGVSGFYNSFFLLALMRVVHGCMNSASNPVSFSLIADYFPPDKRATANSIIQAGNYIGVGISSFSILLITQFGWRGSYGVMGALGALTGLLCMLFIREPERGRYLDEATKLKEKEKKEKAEKEALENPKNPVKAFVDNLGLVFTLNCARNTLIASSLRNFGGMIVSTFLPVFFGRNFPAFKGEYAVLNAFALTFCGMAASLAGGIIADKFEKKSLMTKAYLCISGCIASVPLIALGCLSTSNFYLSVLCYALKVLVSGTYSGPAITMIQNTSPQSQQGNVVSVYFFCITLAQTVSPVLFGLIANYMGALTNPALYGPLIFAFVFLSYLGSVPFWWQAGKDYKKFMEEKELLDQEKLLNNGQGKPLTA